MAAKTKSAQQYKEFLVKHALGNKRRLKTDVSRLGLVLRRIITGLSLPPVFGAVTEGELELMPEIFRDSPRAQPRVIYTMRLAVRMENGFLMRGGGLSLYPASLHRREHPNGS
jgi:hypothetical protein